MPRKSEVIYTGGDGSSIQNAVVIEGATSPTEGIRAENDFISRILGPQNESWVKHKQRLIIKDDIPYELIEAKLPDNNTRAFFFNIKSFFATI